MIMRQAGSLLKTTAIAVVVFLLGLGCGSNEETAIQQPPPQSPSTSTPYEGVIVAVGDSLTAGYGLSEDQAYPALLETMLRANGYPFKVVNAGISGETTSGARSRIDWIMTLNPDIVILATGANDGLRGIDPTLTRENIDAIVDEFKSQGVAVVLGGMKMVKNMGKEFTDAFEGIYPAVAEEKGVILVPFILEGVAGEKHLNLPDGIHPTAEGYEKVAALIYPYVVQAVATFRNTGGLEPDRK
jgi:acyl-CoA thioesterase-1